MRQLLLVLCCLSLVFGCLAQGAADRKLAAEILHNHRLDTVRSRALALLGGFSAGTSYSEVWIRDFNTFIAGSLKVHPKEEVADRLLLFFKSQGDDGNIVDGLVDSTKANGGYKYRYSKLLPGWAAHKNTVETDQESSLIQAVKKYVDLTGDRAFLLKDVGGITVFSRMEAALNYITDHRWSARYGLVIGATTIDWGDVQPETGWGVAINDHTKWAIDIYDNAMFAIAVNDFLQLKPRDYQPTRDWEKLARDQRTSVRTYLWDASAKKYKPHIYLDGSPFPVSFDESALLYSGGSICAILAGFNTRSEVAEINRQLVNAATREKFASIGMTVYPPYPADAFPNMRPYIYQNGGDWTWFGGRMINALLSYGYVTEACKEIDPMIDRVLSHHGFFEWYDVRTGDPKGSGDFRGEAGVLYDAIQALRTWAFREQSSHYGN